MTTTTTQEIRDAVHQTLAGRVLERLSERGAEEERSLRGAAAAIQTTRGHDGHFGVRHTQTAHVPQTIITETLRKMAELGMIRRLSHKGTTYVATASATSRQIADAARRSKKLRRKPNRAKQCGRISYRQAANEYMPGDNSQEPQAYTYEGSVAKDAVEAETPYSIEREARDTQPPETQTKKTTEVAKRRMAYQKARPAMMRNNAHNAKARWIKTEAGQEWLRRKRLVQQASEEEKAIFSAA